MLTETCLKTMQERENARFHLDSLKPAAIQFTLECLQEFISSFRNISQYAGTLTYL